MSVHWSHCTVGLMLLHRILGPFLCWPIIAVDCYKQAKMSPPIQKILMVILNVMVKEYNTVPLIQVAYVRRLYAKTFKYNLDIAALENRKPSKMWIFSSNISLTLLIDREKKLILVKAKLRVSRGKRQQF